MTFIKKTILVSVLLFYFQGLDLIAQDFPEEPKIAVREGDLLLTGFLSYPNWSKFNADLVLGNAPVEEYDLGGVAPLGVKIEYMLSNQFGFTVDGIYNSWSASWISNPNDAPKSLAVQRYRVQIGLNYHMDDLGSINLDIYAGFGIGSNHRDIKVSDNNMPELLSLLNNPISNFPISSRFRVGGRYFLSENIAINFELASGGPVLSGGLTFLLN